MPPAHHFDLFISHASDDKASVVTPLSECLRKRGRRVWLDELELTLGDSLNGRIDHGLAQSQFGVVVLSRAFFAKAWPKRELAALAAREVGSNEKVILPIWHGIDHTYLTQNAPMLADRLSIDSEAGVERVADAIERVLNGAVSRQETPSIKTRESTARTPRTPDERDRLLHGLPPAWEYLLFGSHLDQGRVRLEPKWHDHELELARGTRRYASPDTVSDTLSQETHWVVSQIEALDRLMSPQVQERAFGEPGESGDAHRIEHLATRIVDVYEGLLDWAASLRNLSVPDAWEELRNVNTRMVDGPIRQIRAFMLEVVEQLDNLPAMLAAREDGEQLLIQSTLTLEIDPETVRDQRNALTRLKHRLRT